MTALLIMYCICVHILLLLSLPEQKRGGSDGDGVARNTRATHSSGDRVDAEGAANTKIDSRSASFWCAEKHIVKKKVPGLNVD